MSAGLLVPTVFSLWTGFQCLAVVPGGGGAPGSACHHGPGITLTSADGNSIVDSWTCSKLFNNTDFADTPTIRFSLVQPERTYTVIAVDPDKSGLRYGEFQLHWILANIPEKEFYTGKVESAETVADWISPAPPTGSGLHRYQVYVFEQTTSKVNLTMPTDRNLFKLNAWLQSPGVVGQLCGPIAGIEFLAGPGPEPNTDITKRKRKSAPKHPKH